nr:MAG TPA: hypothetical protein [Caudoviricetes sp.]DAZ62178.1 MAG TPA: hypothetical protein [Caudoviricetes sp.]
MRRANVEFEKDSVLSRYCVVSSKSACIRYMYANRA